MKNIILTITALCFVCGMAQAAKFNQDNPLVAVVHVGSPSADALVPAFASSKRITITRVALLNGAAVAASDTDYLKLELKVGGTIVAELDSRAAHENALAQNAIEALNLVSGQENQAANAVFTVNYDETDSGTAVALTNAQVLVEYYTR